MPQRTVNSELIELYWNIGYQVLIRQGQEGWGSGVVKRLAEDLRAEFPEMTGFSQRNLQYMRTMVEAWGTASNVPQAVAQLPWGHIRTILDKTESREARNWYSAAALEYGWSRNVLLNMMMSRTMERSGTATSNFKQQLPRLDSELAQQVAKDPYVFDFLGLSGEVAERDLEKALLDRIIETLRDVTNLDRALPL